MIARCLLSALLFLQLNVMCSLTAAVSATSVSQKPVLLVVHSDACLPCRDFDRAWQSDERFRTALQNLFDVRSLNWNNPQQRKQAQDLGVSLLPSFVAQTSDGWSDPVAGYVDTPDGKADLLNVLRLTQPQVRAPRPERRAESDRPPVQTVTQSTTIDTEAREQIRQISRTQQAIGEDLKELSSAVNRSVSDSRKTAEQLQSVQQDVAGIRSEVGRTAQSLTQQIRQTREATRSDTRTELRTVTERLNSTISETIHDRLKHISTEIPVAKTPRQDPAGNPVAGWILKLGLSGAAAYFGLPIAGAGLAAGVVSWIVTRRRSRRRAAAGPIDGASGDRVTVLREDVTRKTTDNHYVVKETDRVGEAYKEAIRRTCAAYKNDKPGIVDVARQIEHVANELLRGQDVTARAAQAPRPGIWDDSTEGR